jgi:uncharacterized repeat protein (TIGR04042 family)
MPEVHFRVRWPDGGLDTCYSPSTVIKDFFVVGQPYPLDEFLQRSRSGLNAASERIRALYGMHCSRALGQLAAIEAKAKSQPTDGTPVRVEAFSA